MRNQLEACMIGPFAASVKFIRSMLAPDSPYRRHNLSEKCKAFDTVFGAQESLSEKEQSCVLSMPYMPRGIVLHVSEKYPWEKNPNIKWVFILAPYPYDTDALDQLLDKIADYVNQNDENKSIRRWVVIFYIDPAQRDADFSEDRIEDLVKEASHNKQKRLETLGLTGCVKLSSCSKQMMQDHFTLLHELFSQYDDTLTGGGFCQTHKWLKSWREKLSNHYKGLMADMTSKLILENLNTFTDWKSASARKHVCRTTVELFLQSGIWREITDNLCCFYKTELMKQIAIWDIEKDADLLGKTLDDEAKSYFMNSIQSDFEYGSNKERYISNPKHMEWELSFPKLVKSFLVPEKEQCPLMKIIVSYAEQRAQIFGVTEG